MDAYQELFEKMGLCGGYTIGNRWLKIVDTRRYALAQQVHRGGHQGMPR
jgi:hypothetical protein